MGQRETTVPIHRIEFDVNWPPGHVVSYLVDCEEPVLVDAGMPGTEHETVLRDGLAARDYALADIEHLVLTHPHVDHIGQVTSVVEAADPTVYAPTGVQARFARDLDDLGVAVRENATRAGLEGAQLETAVGMAVESLRRNRELLPVDTVDVWVDGGETVDVGRASVDVVHVPGHQADQCCFLVELDGERVLVSGDAAIEPFRPVVLHTGLDRGVESAIDAFYTTLDRLEALSPDRVYPGHGPVHTDFDSVVARDRAHLNRMLDRTVERLADGPQTAVEVAKSRTDDSDITYIVPEVVSALRHLEANGKIEGSAVDGVVRYVAPVDSVHCSSR